MIGTVPSQDFHGPQTATTYLFTPSLADSMAAGSVEGLSAPGAGPQMPPLSIADAADGMYHGSGSWMNPPMSNFESLSRQVTLGPTMSEPRKVTVRIRGCAYSS